MRKGQLFPLASPYAGVGPGSKWYNQRVRATGEWRNPQRGEWFISGAIPEGYLAPSALSNAFHIAQLVHVKIITTVEVIEDV
jgi:hypothetical protein